MTKDVKITISGLHLGVDDTEPIETVTVGQYAIRDGKHYLRYEEFYGEANSTPITAKCLMKITPEGMELSKKGGINVSMQYYPERNSGSCYNFGFGEMFVNVYTTSYEIKEEENLILLSLKYNLSVNYEPLSECSLSIRVEALPEASRPRPAAV